MNVPVSFVRIQLLALLVMAALSPLACATSPAPPTSGDADVVATLTAKANAWDKAIVSKDRAAVAANMSEDFRLIGGAANIQDKRAFVDDVIAAGLKIDPYTVEDFEIRVYGDVALLSGRTTMTGSSDGAPFESRYRYIDVYVRGTDGWKVVSVQITRIPK